MKDVSEQFLECKKVTDTLEWEELKAQHQTKAGEARIPGTLVQAVMKTLEGKEVQVEIRTGLHLRLFRAKGSIRWRNLVKGRVHRERHLLQKREQGRELMSSSAWQVGLVGYVLELFWKIWKLRFVMVATADREKEREPDG